jgi:hypothetical protein
MNFYKPSISLEEYTQMYFSNNFISLNPSKLQKYEKFLINEISSYYKINILIIKKINNNLTIDILNKHNITHQKNHYLSYEFLNTWYSTQTIKFSNKSLYYINKFLSINSLSQYKFDYESLHYSINNEYFNFVHNYIYFFIFKINELIDFVNKHSHKLININKKLNKYINYIAYLNQSDNKKIIDNFLRKKIDSHESNKIIIKFTSEIKELELQYRETIGKIFSNFDYKNIIYNLNGERYERSFIKNDVIRFIVYLSKFTKLELKNLEGKNSIYDLIKNKNYDLLKIEEIIKEFQNIAIDILNKNYNLRLYSHRQKIINVDFHYLRNLYNEIKNISSFDAYKIINNLAISKELIFNKNIISFLLKIATTETPNLIYL